MAVGGDLPAVFGGREVVVSIPLADTAGPDGRPPAHRVASEFLMSYRGNTLAAYTRNLHEWFEWCQLFDTDPLDATKPLVTAYIAFLRNDLRRRDSTVGQKLSTITGLYRYAHYEDYITALPIPDRRRLGLADGPDEITLGPDREQGKALVKAAGRRGARDRAIVLTLLCTGLRVSELCGLRMRDMGTWETRRFVEVTRKGGRRDRVLVVPDAAAAIDVYLDERPTGRAIVPAGAAVPSGSEPLFVGRDGYPMTRHQVDHVVRWSSRTAFPDAPRVFHPHALRHTAITQMILAGRDLRDVQLAAGHATPQTTEGYIHTVEQLSKSALAVLDTLFT